VSLCSVLDPKRENSRESDNSRSGQRKVSQEHCRFSGACLPFLSVRASLSLSRSGAVVASPLPSSVVASRLSITHTISLHLSQVIDRRCIVA